jgi:hypothetical protein
MAEESLETQLRRLAAIVAPLAETVNQHDARLARLDALLAEQVAMNRQQAAINADVRTTLARIETLLKPRQHILDACAELSRLTRGGTD